MRRFRELLLWPLQLMPLREDVQIHRHWELIAQSGPENAWREVADEFAADPGTLQERHYAEFVNFLPYVQRVLYGEGKGTLAQFRESPIRVFRRCDVHGVRITLDRDSAPIDFRIAHVDLYFFFDMDIVIPVVEIFGGGLELATVQNVLFRFGRAYPPIGKRMAGAGTAHGACSGLGRAARCSRSPISSDARSIWHSSVSIERRRSPRTGSGC